MALGLPGPIPSCVSVEFLLGVGRNGPGASWAKSTRLPYQLLIITGWRMVLEFPGPIPTAFLGIRVSSMGNDPGVPLSSSMSFPYQALMISLWKLPLDTSSRLPY